METIKRKILVISKANVEICVDDYEQGEGEFVNFWDLDVRGVYDTMEDLINRINKESYCFTNKLENYIYCDNSIQTDSLVDNENLLPSESQIQRWKEGKETLYNAHLSLLLCTIGDIHNMTEDEARKFGLEIY